MITAAISGVLLAATYAAPVHSQPSEAVGECHGVNACKGQGDCGGVTDGHKHGCSGKNACEGKGWLAMTKPACDEKGGKFKPKS